MKIIGTSERPRLVIYRSLRYVYGQIVDDQENKTLIGVSDLNKDLREQLKDVKSKVEASKKVGEYLAKKAQEKNIKKIVFDRNGYKYHGRVKALADGAREGGLEF
jgi:large subunit ribosomal protein L18